jgi:hypothetical protein
MNKFVQFLIGLAMLIIIVISIPTLLKMYYTWESTKEINQEVFFQQEKNRRYDHVKEKLELIRKVELAYKDNNGVYTQNWDELMSFIKTDSIKKVLYTGSLTDEMIESGMTENEAIKKGVIKRDTVTTSVIDYIFKNKKDIDKLKFIIDDELISLSSNTNNLIQTLTISAHNDIILKGLDLELTRNINGARIRTNRYPGLMIEI